MELKDIIKMERIKRDWTLEYVGKQINRSANAIWHYENGSRTIDSETIELFSELFGYEWRKKILEQKTFKTVRELYKSLPEEVAYESIGKFYYKWKPEEFDSKREKLLCQNINERLALYGYQLKDKEEEGAYNDIVGYFGMEIIPLSKNIDGDDIMKKDDILIQNPNDPTYVGLCHSGVFKMKMQVGNEYVEVIEIKKEEEGYRLSTFSPLKIGTEVYGYVEECFYHLIPTNALRLRLFSYRLLLF